MAKDNSSGLNWSRARQFKNPRLTQDYIYVPNTSYPSEGLHKNCKGCNHIVEAKCRYVKYPKARKWPCYFREHC